MDPWWERGKGVLSGPMVGEGEWTCGERGGRGLCGPMVRKGGLSGPVVGEGEKGGLSGPAVREREGGIVLTCGGRGERRLTGL